MIPAAIQALLPQHPGEENRIGLSGAQVVMYEDCVLKVQPDTGNAANEGIMLRFLKGRLPVPEVLAEAVQGGMRYLLMTRLRGRMLCDETFLSQLHGQCLNLCTGIGTHIPCIIGMQNGHRNQSHRQSYPQDIPVN